MQNVFFQNLLFQATNNFCILQFSYAVVCILKIQYIQLVK